MLTARTFYNAHNGDWPDIDNNVLSHVVGDPFSYPGHDDMDALIASGNGQGIVSTNAQTVGVGNNGTSLEMSVTNSKGQGTAFDLGVTIESEVGAGGFTAGASAGFHYGESYQITTSERVIYSGSVGGIPEDEWDPKLQFEWGLFSYRGAVGNERFIVLQYYVDPV